EAREVVLRGPAVRVARHAVLDYPARFLLVAPVQVGERDRAPLPAGLLEGLARLRTDPEHGGARLSRGRDPVRARAHEHERPNRRVDLLAVSERESGAPAENDVELLR